MISLGDTREARAPTPDTTTRERERARREPARAMAATSCTVLAGSYERFVFGYALDVGSSDADGTTGGGGARLAKSFTVDAHLSSVKAVACAGGYAASGGSDDLIRVYHCDDRGAMADLGMCVGHRGDVRALTFYSPRGYAPTRLLSGGADGELMVWDATDNFDQLKTMRAHRGGVCSISAHASGRVALTSGADSHVAMWDMKKGRVAYKFKTPDIVDKLMFTSDGARYVSQTTKKITLTDAEAGNVISTFATPAKALCSETRGSMVYVGCEGGDVLVYDTRKSGSDKAVNQIAKAHPQRVRGVALVDTGEIDDDSGPRELITAGSEGVVRVWDMRNTSSTQAETSSTPVAEISTGARYTCLCTMPAKTLPDAPKPKMPSMPPRDQTAKKSTQVQAAKGGSKKVKKKQKAAVVDDGFEIVREESTGPSAKRAPSRFDDDSDDGTPYAKPTSGNKKKRQGSYEKTATSARRQAHGIKQKKRRW